MATVVRGGRQRARAVVRWARKTGSFRVLDRAQIVACVIRGASRRQTAERMDCALSHVSRMCRRFAEGGFRALHDRRQTNGPPRISTQVRDTVARLLQQSPLDYGHRRPTWTRELLLEVTFEQTGQKVSLSSMSRILRRLGARRGRPKPIVHCSLSARQKRRRLHRIRQMLTTLPPDEVAVYEDEVDIHLNPKVGLDWMPYGKQRTLPTPGQNRKAYVAGALDAHDGTVLWVGDTVKNSGLFTALLSQLDSHYPNARRIHVILDNYGIHHSRETKEALRAMPRIRLHFLPPYCPDENRIERLWGDLHANVTRNHQHQTLEDLCEAVAIFLDAASPWPPGRCPQDFEAA